MIAKGAEVKQIMNNPVLVSKTNFIRLMMTFSADVYLVHYCSTPASAAHGEYALLLLNVPMLKNIEV